MFDEPNDPFTEDPWTSEPLSEDAEPRFRYQIWDMLALITAIACFMSTVRAIGWVAIALLPVFLIAPSVLAHPDNNRNVKIGFVVVMLLTTVILYFRAS